METEIKIVEHLLEIQELVGKDSFTKNEIINILKQAKLIVSNQYKKEENYDVGSKSDFCTNEQRDTFNEIMSKITETKKIDKYPDFVFYMVGDYIYMEHDLKNNDFYIRYTNFWSVFESNFNLNYKVISELLRGLLEEHLKCEYTTCYV